VFALGTDRSFHLNELAEILAVSRLFEKRLKKLQQNITLVLEAGVVGALI